MDRFGEIAFPAHRPDPRPGHPRLLLRVLPLDDPSARHLEAMHVEEMRARYGGDGPAPATDSDDYAGPHGCFVVAFVEEDPVGCGGFHRLTDRVAELKRIYALPAHRRQGVATALLDLLEAQAKQAGYSELWLETGIEQPEALALYRARGYVPIVPYGYYRDDPRSRSFSKRL